MNDEEVQDEGQLNEGNEEDKLLNDNELNEVKSDSILTPKSDGYTDILDENNPENKV